MIKRVHANEVHYMVKLEEVMKLLKIPDEPDTDFIDVIYNSQTELFTFTQIEKVY